MAIADFMMINRKRTQSAERGKAAIGAERGLQSAARSEFEYRLSRFSALQPPSIVAE